MLKNVFSRWARGIERSQSGKRRGNSPVPVPMQVEQLEPRQLMTATVGAPETPVFSETYFIGSTVTLAVAAANSGTTNTLEVDRPIPQGFTLRLTDDMNDANPANDVLGSRVVQSTTLLGNGNTRLTLTQNLPANFTIDAGDKVSWLRPWQQSFDRTTQTLWFTNEDGARLGQLDPATGQLKLYDISVRDGLGMATATDPHGAFFDLDTHITPRVWIVQRNASDQDTPAVPAADLRNSRVSYLDLVTNELVTVDLASFITPSLIKETHAAFVDARGHLWISAEKAGKLIELDFDQVFDGTLNPGINPRQSGESLMGRAIIHNIPFASVVPNVTISPHGLGTIVDDRTGEPYIYFTDGEGGTGGIFLLKPGTQSSGFADRWFQWDLSGVLTAEGLITGRTVGRALFLAVNDHETPGRPEDDTLILADPRSGSATAIGSIREIQPQNLIRAIQSGSPIPASSTVRTVNVPVIGGPANSYSSPQLPFSDREGNTFFVDSLGSVGRFNFDDPNLTLLANSGGATSIPANINEVSTTATLFAVTLTPTSAPITQLIINLDPVNSAGSTDLSVGNAIDQYPVSKPNQYFSNNGGGSFRGAINAANVVFGSLSQSDFISTTVFAETARRQMSVVADPTPLPTGAIVEGRMAFQVARNGSLIMTSRGHGMLLDQQRNLSRDRILAGNLSDAMAKQILIDGDSSSVTVTDPNSSDFGDVHVFGKNQVGGIVEYRFDHSTSVWSTNVLPAPATGVLAGEPTAFIDIINNQVCVRVLINRNDGHLLLYQNDGTAPTDLTTLAGGGAPNIFASVAIVKDKVAATDTWFVYGSNQAGSVVEYSFGTTAAIPASATAGTITITSRPTGQLTRDTQIFQSLSVELAGNKRQIFGTDGHSRLVHLEVIPGTLNASGENVTELTKVAATGYFDTFQQGTGQDFAARVYPDLSVLADADGKLFVYGTNGLDLVEFTRSGTSWTAANLTNDIMKGSGDRIPANKVFGAPGAYMTSAGDRHVFQINADGDVIEYAFRKTTMGGHFNTQNINLARGNTYTFLQDINVNLAPTLNIPAVPLDVIAGGAAVLVASDASVSATATTNFATGQLIVRTINGTASDVVRIRPQVFADADSITVAPGVVSVNGAPLGTFSALGGIGSAPLVISFTSAPSKNSLEALLQSLEFSTPGGSTIGVRFVDFELDYQFTVGSEARSNRIAQQVTVDDADPATNPLIHPLL